MLIEILKFLKQGKTLSLQDIAETMNTDIQDVKVKIEYLERNVYIKKVELLTGYAGGCAGCSGCSNCSNGLSTLICTEII